MISDRMGSLPPRSCTRGRGLCALNSGFSLLIAFRSAAIPAQQSKISCRRCLSIERPSSIDAQFKAPRANGLESGRSFTPCLVEAR